jgi:hypothetical protein
VGTFAVQIAKSVVTFAPDLDRSDRIRRPALGWTFDRETG